MRVKIRVTQDHIKNGRQSSSQCCAIALAIRDTEFPGGSPDCTTVNGTRIDMYLNDVYVNCPTPASAARFIRRFDWSGADSVKPFNFFLDIPEPEESR